VILFGPSPTMERVRGALAAAGAVVTDLPMSWAYHTPFVAPMADAFSAVLHEGMLGMPGATVYSCASAGPFPTDPAGIRALMRAQYVSRVRFSETVQRLHDDGIRIFLEVGPGGVLTGFVGDVLRGKPHLALAADSRRAPGLQHLLTVLGELFVNRVPFDLGQLHHGATLGAAAKTAPMPVLDSTLPFIRLDENEVARVRAMLGPTTIDSPVEADAPRAAAESSSGEVAGWTGIMPLPFQAQIELVALETAPDAPLAEAALAQHLGPGDAEYFTREVEPLGPRRQRDWLCGRIAARRAVSAWLGGNGHAATAEIGYDDAGRPILASPTDAPVFLSVSHKDGIGAAAAADRPIGIDLERLTAIRDPQLLMDTAFSADEGAILSDLGWAETGEIAIAWSAKEAAAKSMGRTLLGDETAWAITHVDPQQGSIRLAHTLGDVDAFYALDGDYVCVVATSA
jgi:phosphopantetheinyl transferase